LLLVALFDPEQPMQPDAAAKKNNPTGQTMAQI
jgi:hypothetical protein